MYLRGMKWLAFAATAAALAACGPGNTTSDTGPGGGDGGDVQTNNEGGSSDGGGSTDGGRNDGGGMTDGGGGNTDGGGGDGGGNGGMVCASANVIDLATAGTTTGGVLHYTGNNSSASPTADLPGPSCGVDPMAYQYQVAHKYHTTAAAYLVVSTDNTGTPMASDTIVWVQSACSTTATEIACNDDVSYPDNVHSTATSTDLIPAGTDVYIIVGSYGSSQTPAMPGAYELTVQELQPIAAGGQCDPTTQNLCVAGYSCVAPAGSATGTCNADGSLGANCRPSTATARCDTGLECHQASSGAEVCVTPVAAGSECTVGLDPDPCATGTACAGDFQVGHCVAPGSVPNAPCRSDMTCDTGLTCTQAGFSQVCLRTRALGDTCNFFEDTCGSTALCEPSSQTDTRNGTCVAVGATGGYCDDMNACAAGNTCIMAAGATYGTCRSSTAVATGSACDPSMRTNACVAGNTCAPDSTGTAFTCQANGSAAGTSCTDTGTCGNVLLACSATTGGYCQTTAAVTCNPRYNTNACAAGSVCIATSLNSGSCGGTTAEGSAANDTAATAQSVTLAAGTVAIAGALTPAGDVDCYSFTATAGQKLYAELNNGRAGCNADEATVILLYDSMHRLIDGNFATGQNDPCPILDGASASAAGTPSSNLAAGQYALCVQGTDNTATTASYVLDIHLQ